MLTQQQSERLAREWIHGIPKSMESAKLEDDGQTRSASIALYEAKTYTLGGPSTVPTVSPADPVAAELVRQWCEKHGLPVRIQEKSLAEWETPSGFPESWKFLILYWPKDRPPQIPDSA